MTCLNRFGRSTIGARLRSELGVFRSCCDDWCIETYGIGFTQTCFPYPPDPTNKSFRVCCPPYLQGLFPGGLISEIPGCAEHADALDQWRFATNEATDGVRISLPVYGDLTCTSHITSATNFFWVPAMWQINDPGGPKHGWYRLIILLMQPVGDGTFSLWLVFAGERATSTSPFTFSNLLPAALADWCSTISDLDQIGSGGTASLTPYSSVCSIPAFVQVTLSGFNTVRPGCANCSEGPFDSNNGVTISGVDGVYEVPWDPITSGISSYYYKAAIPGSSVSYTLWTQEDCLGDDVSGSGEAAELTIGMVIGVGEKVLFTISLTASAALLFLMAPQDDGCGSPYCQGKTYASAGACLVNGSIRVDRVAP